MLYLFFNKSTYFENAIIIVADFAVPLIFKYN